MTTWTTLGSPRSDGKSIWQQRQQQQPHQQPLHFSTRDSRLGFVRKVYALFSAQMLTTIVLTWQIMMNEELRYWLLGNFQIVGIGALFSSLISALLLVSSQRLRQTAPYNFALLSLYTTAQSVMVGIFASFMNPRTVCLGTMHTLTAFVALTAWTFANPGVDLSLAGNTLLTLTSCGVLGAFLGGVMHMPLLDNLASLCMAVVFSVYLARDTQMIVGGKHARFKFGPKDHVLAALSLYQDVIGLFLRVLEILARLEEGQRRRYSSGPK